MLLLLVVFIILKVVSTSIPTALLSVSSSTDSLISEYYFMIPTLNY